MARLKAQPCPTCRGAVWVRCPECRGNGHVVPVEDSSDERDAEIREARQLMGLEART
jgi:hypothetical protein